MDSQTINIYNLEAENIAKLHASLTPLRIYNLIEHNFTNGMSTADIGCGIGRDTHWLNQHGFPCVGIDASEEMLKQATKLFPLDNFSRDSLPNLNNLKDFKFMNILCSAVLMHLEKEDLLKACYRLFDLLDISGCLIISVRGTSSIDNRENGKLYSPIIINDFLDMFTNIGATNIFHESEQDHSRNLIWHNFVFKK